MRDINSLPLSHVRTTRIPISKPGMPNSRLLRDVVQDNGEATIYVAKMIL